MDLANVSRSLFCFAVFSLHCLRVAAIAAAAMAFASLAQAQDTRSIHLLHKHTGEEIYVTYKRGGRYDGAALEKLNWFLRDWRKDEPTKMDPKLFDIVSEVYGHVGASGPIHVVSAYRSAGTNAMLRRRSRAVAKASQHIQGRAMDFYIPGVSMQQVRAVGIQLQRGGVGFYPGSANLFVHMDSGSVRHWPRVSRDYLARLFPDGRTVHLPADGRPMPGYEQAASLVIARGGTVAGIGGGEVGEAEMASSSGGGGFFAALFGVRPADVNETRPQTLRGRGGRPLPLPAEAPTAMAELVEPGAQTPVKTQEIRVQMASAPLPRPAPSAQERLAQAALPIAFAPLPVPRPDFGRETPPAQATETAVVMASAPLPVASPLRRPETSVPPSVAEARPSIATLIAATEASIAEKPATPAPHVMAYQAVGQPPAPLNASLRLQSPSEKRPQGEAAAPRKAMAAAPLVAPSLQGHRGRVMLTPVPAPTMNEAQLAAPNPQQLKLIERPDQVVAQSFSRSALAQPQSQRFAGSAVAVVRTVDF